MNVWSGEFRTKYNNYRYGRYEARYAAPSSNPAYAANPAGNVGNGNFLATMFIFRTPKWSTWNEIDVELEPTIPTNVAFNVVDGTGLTTYPYMTHDAAGNVSGGAGYANNQWHTYAFEWLPTGITWYLDGKALPATAARGGYVNGVYTGMASDPIPSKSAKIMMNLWIFGSSAAFGDPAKNKYPFSATYDYFRFYKSNTETTYPCSPTPSCLPAADVMDSQNNPNEPNYPN
jgi:beta-glucanase (GH16 family)